MIYEIIVPAAVGSVIGYFTNWLAIKMLFKPHTAKYIFGVKIPFTPGLIPKERKRIAKSIGEAIGTHLLDDKTILNEVQGIDISGHINKVINQYVEKAEKNQITLGEALKDLNIENTDKVADDIARYFMSNAYKLDIYAKEVMGTAIETIINSDKKIGELLPQELDNYIDNVIRYNTPVIAKTMKSAIMSEHIEEKVKMAIKQYAAAKSGILGMLGGFINTDSIYDSIKGELFSIFDDIEVQKEIEINLIKYKNDIFEENIMYLFSSIQAEDRDLAIKEIVDSISEKTITIFQHDQCRRKIEERISSYIKQILNMKISELLSGQNLDIFNKVKNIIIHKLTDLSIKTAPQIIENIDIEKLVEDKLNKFDIEFTEKLILDISGKELNAITWLGGALGLIIGLVQPLINHLLNI